MRILAWRVGPFDNGTYLIYDDRREAILVDPAMGERETLAAISEHGLRLVEILNTHGHPDHTYGNATVKEAARARLAIHRRDAYRLAGDLARDSFAAPPSEAEDLIDEGPLRFVADIELQALHTPGHTEGSTCFYLSAERTLFSGDLLFKGNVGRFDLPGSDAGAMARSLQRIATLPPETRVYPGHGAPTTIGAELATLRALHEAGVLPLLAL